MCVWRGDLEKDIPAEPGRDVKPEEMILAPAPPVALLPPKPVVATGEEGGGELNASKRDMGEL